MTTLILPIGIPGVGKSTFMEELSEKFNIPIVSSDNIREEMYGNASIQGDYKEVFEEVYKRINKLLIDQNTCILDATHCTRWARSSAIFHTLPDQVIYIVMNNDIEQAKKRNAARERVVPNKVIYKMARNLRHEPPHENEYRNLRIFNWDDSSLLDFLKGL